MTVMVQLITVLPSGSRRMGQSIQTAVYQVDGAAGWNGAVTATGLSANTLYRFRVQAKNGDGTVSTISNENVLYTLSQTPWVACCGQFEHHIHACERHPGWRRTFHHKLFD